MTEPANLAETYFRAWKGKDFDTLRSVLADDATFRGPLGTADGGDECIAGLRGMSQMMTDIVVRKRFVDGADVLTWYDLHTGQAPPCPTANWMHTENGKIVKIRAVFDPRPLLS